MQWKLIKKKKILEPSNDYSKEAYSKQAKAEMDNKSQVNCIHLPWESATKNELQEFMPEIV